MAGRWSDEQIAASLNRMGMPTGQGKTWTAHRVASLRRVRDIHAYRPAEKDGEWLTMSQAAAKLGVTNHRIRRMINDGLLPAEQVVPCAPYQIRASDLMDQKIIDAAAKKSPCRVPTTTSRSQCFQALEEVGHYEQAIAIGRIWFSTQLLSIGRSPSSMKRTSAAQRLRL